MSNRKKTLAKHNFFDELLAIRDKQRKKMENSAIVVQESELPIETNRHGSMQWYLHPNIEDVSVNSLLIYVEHIPPGSKSGRQRHPGGKIFYMWKGKGHTVIDGVSYRWEAGELVQLPLRPDGVVYQHFNDSDDEEAKIFAVEPNYVESLGLDKGSKFEQLEDCPEYKRP